MILYNDVTNLRATISHCQYELSDITLVACGVNTLGTVVYSAEYTLQILCTLN
jgi:hypothetical protein